MRFALLAASALALAACGGSGDPTATASTDAAEAPVSGPAESPSAETFAAPKTLPARLDCLRETGGLLLIGHRGGPTRDYPENAIESFARTLKAGTRAMEIDIAETKDGKLVLMHDDELDRTTTGTGLVADHTLAEIQALNLRTYSKTTDFHAPTLEAALDWAVKSGAFLELDKKRSAAYPPIIAAIRAAKAENNVLLITYTDDQAVEVHRLAPDLVISATLNSTEQLDSLVARGVKPERLLAWTGVTDPRPDLWRALAARGVESIFGATGPRDTAYDTLYWDDSDGAEYNKLAADGLTVLVTGLTDKTSRQLRSETDKAKTCGL
jgi:glycerophosphoryl diester phosphodiesterase